VPIYSPSYSRTVAATPSALEQIQLLNCRTSILFRDLWTGYSCVLISICGHNMQTICCKGFGVWLLAKLYVSGKACPWQALCASILHSTYAVLHKLPPDEFLSKTIPSPHRDHFTPPPDLPAFMTDHNLTVFVCCSLAQTACGIDKMFTKFPVMTFKGTVSACQHHSRRVGSSNTTATKLQVETAPMASQLTGWTFRAHIR